MKRLFLLLIISMFFTNFGYISACQYKINESYQELELGIYDESGDYIGSPLEFNNFTSGGMNINGCTPPTFKVYNTLNEDITINISYKINWHAALGGGLTDKEAIISVNKYSDSEAIKGSCPDIGGGEIPEDSVKYVIVEPEIMTLENEMITKQRTICKTCPNGKECLDDGQTCSLPIECGSNICNIAKVCGSVGTPTIVSCQSGYQNCNNTCLNPSIKQTEESYSCDWECAPGTIPCNGICRAVSSKNAGQEYHCIEECKSGRGEEGKCLKSKEWWIYFIVICIVIIGTSTGYFSMYKRKKEERKRQEAERKRVEEEEKLKDIQKEIDLKKNHLKNLDLEKVHVEHDVKKLKEEIRNVDMNAKKLLEDKIKTKELELEKIKRTEKEIENELNNENEKINLLNEKRKIRKDLAKQNIKNTQEEINLAILKYGGKEKVFVNEYGYVQFKSNLKDKTKKGPLYHIWLYRNKIGIGINQEIHHIDGNKLNNEMWNLIAIDKDLHKYKVEEAKIKNEGWKFGLDYIKNNGIVKESDLHRYIKEHLNEIKKD